MQARHLATAVLLVGALAAAYVFASVPHLDLEHEDVDLFRGYLEWLRGERIGDPNPVHGDELAHWDRAEDVLAGTGTTGSSVRAAVHERGFPVLVADVSLLTGIDTFDLVVRGPAPWAAFSAFALFALLRPHPAAPFVASLAALAPTTPRFLGPGFFVPVAFVLPWLVAVALLAQERRRGPAAVALLLVTVSWAFLLHLVGGAAAVAVLLVLLAPAALRGERAARVVLAALVLGAAILAVVYAPSVAREIGHHVDRSERLAITPRPFFVFGVPALVLAALGATAVAVRPPAVSRPAFVAFTAAAAAFVTSIVATVLLDPGRYATYDRWHVPFFYAAAVPAGYGAWRLGDLLARAVPPRATAAAAWAVPACVVLACLAFAAPVHAEVGHRHVIEDAELEAARWFDANLGPEYAVFTSDPYLGLAAEAITHRRWVDVDALETRHFFRKGVSVVLLDPHPPEYVEVHPGVYALPPEELRRLAPVR